MSSNPTPSEIQRVRKKYGLQCYLCEAARGGTLGGLSEGTVCVPSTCWGPGLRLLVTSGTSLSYANKKRKKHENYLMQPAQLDTHITKVPQPSSGCGCRGLTNWKSTQRPLAASMSSCCWEGQASPHSHEPFNSKSMLIKTWSMAVNTSSI